MVLFIYFLPPSRKSLCRSGYSFLLPAPETYKNQSLPLFLCPGSFIHSVEFQRTPSTRCGWGHILTPAHSQSTLVALSCPNLCDPMDYSPPHSSVLGILQGNFLTRGSKQGLCHCRQILYHPSHQGSPQPVHSPVVMDPRLRLLMAETQDTNPLWSPDGKRTAASRGVQGSLGAPTCTVCSQPTSMWLWGTTNTLSWGSERASRGHIRPNCRSRGSQPRGFISSASPGAGGRLPACRARPPAS